MAANTPKQNATRATQSIASMVDLAKPQELTTFFKTHDAGLESNLFVYAHTLGFETQVGGETYKWTEKNLSHASLTSKNAVSAGAPGAAATYTLDGDSATYVYVRVNDLILYPDAARTIGIVTSVTGTTFTVTPDDTTSLPAVSAGDTLIISSRAYGAASTVGDAAMTKFTKYSNRLQIIKEKVSTSASALAEETWVDFGPKGVYSVQLLDGELRQMRAIHGALMHGKETSTISDVNSVTGAKRGTTQGLVDAAITNGSTLAAPTNITSFDTISNANMANFVATSTPIYSLLGFKAYTNIENAFFGSSSVLVDSPNFLSKASDSKLFNASESYGAYMNFKYLNKKYTYMFETNEAWSDPTAYGAYGYDEKGLMIPIRKVKDGMSGEKFGTIGMRYKSQNGLNRKFMIDSMDGFGSINGKAINETDLTSTVWLSHIGAHHMGSEQYVALGF
jgi:hypothetical protein